MKKNNPLTHYEQSMKEEEEKERKFRCTVENCELKGKRGISTAFKSLKLLNKHIKRRSKAGCKKHRKYFKNKESKKEKKKKFKETLAELKNLRKENAALK